MAGRGITPDTRTVVLNLDGRMALEVANMQRVESIYSVHRSSTGDEIMICQMTDEHLRASVARLLQHLSEAHPSNFKEDTLDPLTAALTTQTKQSYQEDNRTRFLFLLKCLEPYMLELSIRGLAGEFTTALQVLFDRSGAVNAPRTYAMADKLRSALPDTVHPLTLETDD